MELKDLILSTLDELDLKVKREKVENTLNKKEITKTEPKDIKDEMEFLLKSKERFEVLFDGLNLEENQKLEAKINLIKNFLQFYLAKIDERLEKLKHE